MTLIIFAIIVLICAALIVWAIDTAPIGDSRIKWLIKALVLLLAALVIAQKAGLLS